MHTNVCVGGRGTCLWVSACTSVHLRACMHMGVHVCVRMCVCVIDASVCVGVCVCVQYLCSA